MRSRTLFAAVLALLSGNAMATNWYASPTGSDSYDGKSAVTPKKSLDKLVTLVAAGDSIFVAPGTYSSTTTITITTSGTAAKKIWMGVKKSVIAGSWPTDVRPVLDFSGMAIGGNNQGIVLKAGYWHIHGLRIKGAGDNGMLVRSSAAKGNVIEFTDFYQNRDAGFQMRESASNNLILNCDSYNNADYVAGSSTYDGGNADGFAPKLDLGTGNVFRGCRAWGNSDDGWDGYLKAKEVGLPDGMTTVVDSCWAFSNGYDWKTGATTSGMNGNGIKMGGSANKDQAHNFIVKNSIAWNNKSKGFDQNNSAGSLRLYNCLSVNNKAQDYALNSSGVTYASGSFDSVVNSVAVGTKGTSFRSGSYLVTNNFAATSAMFAGLDGSQLSSQRKADGRLPTIVFGTLKAGSALIDAGTKVGIAYAGTKPDLGAFEYGATSSNGSGTGTVTPANKAPTVSLVTSASTAKAPATVTLTATAADADGSVAKVELLQNGTVVQTRTAAPYSFSVASLVAGTYAFTARATDNSGASTVSSGVGVVVSAAASTSSYSLSLSATKANWADGMDATYSAPATSSSVKLQIYNASGTQVKSTSVSATSGTKHFSDVSGYAAGTYTVRLVVNGTAVLSKTISKL